MYDDHKDGRGVATLSEPLMRQQRLDIERTPLDMNDNRSLGEYSEEGLEANNKDVRNFLEHLSRICDNNKQFEDVHQHILERSDLPSSKHLIATDL